MQQMKLYHWIVTFNNYRLYNSCFPQNGSHPNCYVYEKRQEIRKAWPWIRWSSGKGQLNVNTWIPISYFCQNFTTGNLMQMHIFFRILPIWERTLIFLKHLTAHYRLATFLIDYGATLNGKIQLFLHFFVSIY